MEEILVNEDMIEVTEGVASTGMSKGMKIGLAVGAVALVGGLAYKFLIKPAIEKRAAQMAEAEIPDYSVSNEDDAE